MTALTRPQAMRIARQMFDGGHGGWTVPGIHDYLTQREFPVSRTTVRRWVDFSYQQRADRARRERGAQVRAVRAGGRLRMSNPLTPAFKMERVRALRELRPRLSFDQIAALLCFDTGDLITGDQVQYALTVGRYPSLVHERIDDEARRLARAGDPDVQKWIDDEVIAA